MNRCSFLAWPLALVIGVLPACETAARDEQACAVQLLGVPEKSAAIIDIERLVPDIVELMGTADYWNSIEPILTKCKIPKVLLETAKAKRIRAFGGPEFKPIELINVEDVKGIVFLHLITKESEMVEGIAATLVEYDSSGKPQDSRRVAEFVSFEGYGSITSSVLSGGSISRCTQKIECFFYADNGDILGELSEPRRAPKKCEQQAPLNFKVESA